MSLTPEAQLRGALILMLAAAGPLAAQSPPLRRLCFQAKLRPACAGFVISEFGGSIRVASNHVEDIRSLFQWSLGAVKNVSSTTGIGGAALLTWSEGATAIGVGPRLRYWASYNVSFDLAPGLIVFQGGSRNLGFNGQLAVNLGPHVSLTTTLQTTDDGFRRYRRVGWYAGARLNGKAGAVSGIAAPILTFLGYLALFSLYSD